MTPYTDVPTMRATRKAATPWTPTLTPRPRKAQRAFAVARPTCSPSASYGRDRVRADAGSPSSLGRHRASSPRRHEDGTECPTRVTVTEGQRAFGAVTDLPASRIADGLTRSEHQGAAACLPYG